MDTGMVILRLTHIVLGAFWVGAIFFTALFLMPAMAEAGPDGQKVAAGLQRRRFMVVMPIVALLTILSGIDLMRRVSGGFQAAWFESPSGRTYAIGGVVAIVAFLIGVLVMRPLMLKAAKVPPAEAGPLRKRAMLMNQVVAVLLVVAVAAMAVARYV